MTTVPNTLASNGPTFQQKWGSLGAGTGRMTNQSPQGAISMLIGAGGSGKTTLLCSNPECLIINLDTHSAPIQDVKAGVWPLKSSDGSLVDGSGHPIDFTWENVESKILKPLVEAAKSKVPRPKMVAFDTVPLAIKMVQDALCRKGGVSEWKKLHGQTAWDDLFNTIIGWGLVLNRVGYGVVYNVHVRDSVVKLSEEQSIVTPTLSITDKFFGRLHPICEFIAHVYRADEAVTIDDPRRPGNKTVVKQTATYLSTPSTTDAKTSAFLKSRYPLRDVKLSRDNGWADLMAAWSAAEVAANPRP